MANTRADVSIATGGAWTNLFTASGVTVGTACTVYNKGSEAIYVAIATAQPGAITGAPFGIPVEAGKNFVVATGASGLWGASTYQNGTVLVQD